MGIWACRKAGVTAGDRVLVTGAGPIGLLAMQVALAFGATQVEVSDVNETRLAFASRTGATRTLISRPRRAVDRRRADRVLRPSGRAVGRDRGAAARGNGRSRRHGAG